MKNIIFVSLLLFLPIWVYSQISITEFRKLEEKVNNLVTENQQLKEKVASVESKLNQANRTNRNRNSSTKQSLEEQMATQESTVNAQIAQMKSEINSSIRSNERKMNSAISQLNNTLPVGSIVPYHLDPKNLPDNWVLCHGQKITDSESIYYGYKVPYLKGYFIRGRKDSESNGDKGGDDYISSHSHSIPSHKHEVGSHTHDFVTNSAKITSNRYCPESNYGISCFEGRPDTRYFLATRTKGEYEQATVHSHSGRTGNASSGYTQNGGEGKTGSSNGHSNVPKYKAFNYIIKIK